MLPHRANVQMSLAHANPGSYISRGYFGISMAWAPDAAAVADVPRLSKSFVALPTPSNVSSVEEAATS